jgi:hypothetical protein
MEGDGILRSTKNQISGCTNSGDPSGARLSGTGGLNPEPPIIDVATRK